MYIEVNILYIINGRLKYIMIFLMITKHRDIIVEWLVFVKLLSYTQSTHIPIYIYIYVYISAFSARV